MLSDTPDFGGASAIGSSHLSQHERAAVKYREIVRLIKEDGWRLVRQRGSHAQYAHPTRPGKVTIAGHPNKDAPRGTAANILRQAGLPRPKP